MYELGRIIDIVSFSLSSENPNYWNHQSHFGRDWGLRNRLQGIFGGEGKFFWLISLLATRPVNRFLWYNMLKKEHKETAIKHNDTNNKLGMHWMRAINSLKILISYEITRNKHLQGMFVYIKELELVLEWTRYLCFEIFGARFLALVTSHSQGKIRVHCRCWGLLCLTSTRRDGNDC